MGFSLFYVKKKKKTCSGLIPYSTRRCLAEHRTLIAIPIPTDAVLMNLSLRYNAAASCDTQSTVDNKQNISNDISAKSWIHSRTPEQHYCKIQTLI